MTLSATGTYRIAAVPGDGIGKETVAAARKVLDVVAQNEGFTLNWIEYPWGCDYYFETGRMMPVDGITKLAESDAILLGAVGRADVPDHVSLWGLLIPIRRSFDQYVSLRPARLLPGIESPLVPSREALDVSVQAGVLNLLDELQVRLNLAYVFIAHDLSVVRHISHEVAVMYLGRIVEQVTTDKLYENPLHPYTKALISAVPVPDPRIERSRQRILLEGDLPSPLNLPAGCSFKSRCWKSTELCDTLPLLTAHDDHFVACHHPENA